MSKLSREEAVSKLTLAIKERYKESGYVSYTKDQRELKELYELIKPIINSISTTETKEVSTEKAVEKPCYDDEVNDE